MPLADLDFKKVEAKLSEAWEAERLYAYNERAGAREFSIDSPPPFTSGALHMGHVLSYSFFDIAARFKRAQGFNVYYPQGWDCQGFPTEVKVEKKFGLNKLARKEFLEKCREFTETNIVAMKRQMRLMGFSPDWALEYKTMDPSYHRKVQLSLLKMFEKNDVYSAKFPVLFCTHCRSAIAKAETEEVEQEGTLYFVKWEAAGKELVIATTRPELLHACQGVSLAADHPLKKDLVGKTARMPLYDREVPIFSDAEVDMNFGTGAVMMCSYGDKTDVVWFQRHSLKPIEAMDEAGRMKNSLVDGVKSKEAKPKIVELLKAKGLIVKEQKLKQTVKTHDRCGSPVEFLASSQWFVRVKEYVPQIIAAAKSMQWFPEFSVQYLLDWADALEWDWCISRSRIYGTPIPFWQCEKCAKIRPAKESELPVDPATQSLDEKCSCGGMLIGEKAVCDCWVDSSITPMIIAGWPDNMQRFAKAYPVSLRPQGLEIIRTWAFYSIFRSNYLTGKPPFAHVLINGSVLGNDMKKMSKSLGNYEDPDMLMQKYPTDALRQWTVLSGEPFKDRQFLTKDVDRAQSFLKKVWNASKFVEKALEGYDGSKPDASSFRLTDKFILNRLEQTIETMTASMERYEYYTAITALHAFFWNDFCDQYLEQVKFRVYDNEQKAAAQFVLRKVLDESLRLLAPFSPFVADEVYRELFDKNGVHKQAWPRVEEEYKSLEVASNGERLNLFLSLIRKQKAAKGLPLNGKVRSVKVFAPADVLRSVPLYGEELKRVGGAESIETEVSEKEDIQVTF